MSEQQSNKVEPKATDAEFAPEDRDESKQPHKAEPTEDPLRQLLFVDFRPYLDANPEYGEILRKNWQDRDPAQAQDVARILLYAPQRFGNVAGMWERCDTWLYVKLKPERGTGIEQIPLRQIANWLEAECTGTARVMASADHAKGAEQFLPPARHSDDFSSVHWYGDDYTFTATQAACVKVLWQNWENKTPDVRQETILEAAEAESRRLPDIFKTNDAETGKRGMHRAWGTMIQSKTRGTYRLVEPE